MTLEDLENVWVRHAPSGGQVPSPGMVARLRHEADAATRRFNGMVVMAVLLFLIGWTAIIGAHYAGLKRFTVLQAATQVAGSAFYLLWGAIALRSKRAVARERERMGGTVRDSLEASARTVRLQIQNYRIAGGTLVVAVAVTAVLSLAKVQAGELPELGALASTAVVGCGAIGVGVAMWWRHVRELRPRSEELARELSAMQSAER